MGALPSEKFLEENVKKRQNTGLQISAEVEKNCEEARRKQQRDFKKSNLKKRPYTAVNIGDKVLKFNASRAGRKAKGDLGTNYTGPFVVDDIVGGVVKLKTLNGAILKTSVALNNIKPFLDESVNEDINVTTHSVNTATSQVITTPPVNTAISQMKTTPPVNTATSQMKTTPPVNTALSQVKTTPPVNTATSQVKTTAPVNTATSQVKTTTPVNTATSQVKTTPPVNVTAKKEEAIHFLKMPSDPIPLAKGERLTVCGEGVEETNLQTLEGNNWVDDQVIYIKYIDILPFDVCQSATVCPSVCHKSLNGHISQMF
ncbi:hypothetical protein DPMN_031389 [Dreissena polymorpha]|uniref:Uncharacterized protein n=1 Tax=Dreissena polymorpha TaxID=45954 RepID=A0A9D4M2H3_DREPO|nr:hypothetical protein DPMN_031389 [Dreissena polymorpha]